MVKPALWIYLIGLVVTAIVIYITLRWRQNKPLIHHFTSSTIWKAFVLNSIAASLVIFIAVTTKNIFDSYFDDNGDDDIEDDDHNVDKKQKHTNPLSVFLTLTSTFMTSMLAYTILYVLFGFGGGMISVSNTE